MAQGRWRRAGSYPAGSTAKGGQIPWSFIQVCDDIDSLGLLDLVQKIPDEWVDWSHGGKRRPEKMHSTLLLKMTGTDHLPRLQSLSQDAAPIHVAVRQLFCEHVDRISSAEVYCIGVGLESPGLRAMKDLWVSQEIPQQRKVHVPYDSEGHVSLAYIRGDRRQQAEQFVARHAPQVTDGSRSLQVDEVIYQDQNGKHCPIKLAGALGAAELQRARKVPRVCSKPQPIEIDGSVLEGGGQILRMSTAYAALFGTEIHISKIRAGRSKPGLAAQHLESLRLVRDVSAGSLNNDRIGATSISFAPGQLSAGTFTADPGTAGAITLMVQASLFPLLFAGSECFCDLRGGTDVGYSPPLDFLCEVLLPTIRRMGVTVIIDAKSRGFFPRGGGQVHVHVPAATGMLKPIDLSERGEPARAISFLWTTKAILPHEQQTIINAVSPSLSGLASEVNIELKTACGAEGAAKLWVSLIVETTTGALFHGGSEPRDLPGFGKAKGKGSNLAESFTMAVQEALKPLKVDLNAGGSVGCHLCDQLILPASLAAGRSRLLAGELSMHTQTAIHIAKLMIPDVQIDVRAEAGLNVIEIDGIGQDRGLGLPPPAPKAAVPLAPGDVVQLTARALSSAAEQLMQDFRNDLSQLSEMTGTSIVMDVEGDRLLLSGDAPKCAEARSHLKDMIVFYFG